jgi:hypothetical protein
LPSLRWKLGKEREGRQGKRRVARQEKGGKGRVAREGWQGKRRDKGVKAR